MSGYDVIPISVCENFTNLRMIVMPTKGGGAAWRLIADRTHNGRRTLATLSSGWVSGDGLEPSPLAAALLLQSAAAEAVEKLS